MTPPPVGSSARPPVEPPIVNRRPIPANGNNSQLFPGPIDLTSEPTSITGIAHQAPIPTPNRSTNIPKPPQTGQLNTRTDIGSKRPSVSQEIYSKMTLEPSGKIYNRQSFEGI